MFMASLNNVYVQTNERTLIIATQSINKADTRQITNDKLLDKLRMMDE